MFWVRKTSRTAVAGRFNLLNMLKKKVVRNDLNQIYTRIKWVRPVENFLNNIEGLELDSKQVWKESGLQLV